MQESKIAQEKEKLTKQKSESENLLNVLVAKTLARHCDLSSEEYIENALKYPDKDKTEDEIVRIALFNLRLEKAKTIIRVKQQVQLITAKLQMFLLDNDKKNIIESEEENGKERE